MLFAFGSNGSGQLGLGHNDDVDVPKATLFSPSQPPNDLPVAVTAGGNHTIIRTASGKAYTTGDNTDGRCGLTTPQVSQFHKLDWHEIKLCAATWETTSFVDIHGCVYVCGTGNRGELGLGESITHASKITSVSNFPPDGTSVIDLSASMGHTVAVLSNGEVWGWGNGRKGQLGQPATYIWSPRKIIGIPFKAVRASCGKDFTFIVGPPDEGTHIVIGSDKWNIISSAPELLPHWSTIGTGWGAIYVLLSSGKLLAWGRNDHGQLPPAGLPTLKNIVIGSEHALAQTDSDQVLAWGWGEHGNCGPTENRGDVKDRWNEIPVTGGLKGIGAGCATSWIITDQAYIQSATSPNA